MADTSYMDKPTILVVDDTPDNLSLMSGLLKDLYKVKIANNGERALKVAMTGIMISSRMMSGGVPVVATFRARSPLLAIFTL